jgi:DNA-directed RNA polymerase subunit omega
MARVTVEDCLKNVDSRFTLVHLAVRRVLQLRHGAPATMENTKGNKEVVLALREIASGRINLDNIRQIEEARPLVPESASQELEQARADLKEIVDLKEIMEEATAFGPSIGYEGADQVIEGEEEQGQREEED